MAADLRKFLPIASPSHKRANSDSDDESSNSYQIDSFAVEYEVFLINSVPRVLPVEVDQISTALPVSFSPDNISSYPVAQPLVRANKVTKKKKGLVDDPVGSSSVVLRGHHVVSGSSSSSKSLEVSEEAVDLPLSPSSLSFAEIREDTLEDLADLDVESACESSPHLAFDGENDGEPIVDSESDESSHISDGESIAPTPRAERKGKKGSCYRCLLGNRFTLKEVCIVCDAKYCSNCVLRVMGAMPEGRKCQTCIGNRINESKRGSLGKCSRMLKCLLTYVELRQVMNAEISCKANQLLSRLITVNGQPLDEEELYMLQSCPNPPEKLKVGKYWYDRVSGYWGKVGEKPCQIISPHMNIGGNNVMKDASNGYTEIYINDREITSTELLMLKMLGVQCEGKPHFWINSDGQYQEEGQKRFIGNIWAKKKARIFCALLSLPIPPTSSAVESTDDPVYDQKMVNKLLLIGFLMFKVLSLSRKREASHNLRSQDLKTLIQPKQYSYAEVKKITNSFSHTVGKGGFGTVYGGNLNDGRKVAVKVLKDFKSNGEDFINEVASMSQTSHVNIVSLLGFCFEGSKRAIVYEFLENGSLDQFISKKNSLKNLDVSTLYGIALGVARGLEYLHHGCKTRIVHFDIKPQNVLLDDNFCPKVSDFGLAKLCDERESILSLLDTRGTIGYIAPEVFSRMFGRVSHKSDVYSYGMLVLEMIGARNKEVAENAASNASSTYFPDWIYKNLENEEHTWIIGDQITREEKDIAKKMILVGLWCIQSSPSNRPAMNKVVEMMEGSLDALVVPPKPSFHSSATPPPESSWLSKEDFNYSETS